MDYEALVIEIIKNNELKRLLLSEDKRKKEDCFRDSIKVRKDQLQPLVENIELYKESTERKK